MAPGFSASLRLQCHMIFQKSYAGFMSKIPFVFYKNNKVWI